MRYYYGEKTFLRVLDEAKFWKRQEAEHTVVIRELVNNLEPEFVNQLEKFEESFNRTKGMVVRYIETVVRSKGRISPTIEKQILELIDYCLRQSQQFIRLLNRLLTESRAVRGNMVAATVINHIRRESEYFIGIAQTVLAQAGKE